MAPHGSLVRRLRARVELLRRTFQPDKTFNLVSSISSFLPLARHVGPSHLHISASNFISRHVRFRFLRSLTSSWRIYKDRPNMLGSRSPLHHFLPGCHNSSLTSGILRTHDDSRDILPQNALNYHPDSPPRFPLPSSLCLGQDHLPPNLPYGRPEPYLSTVSPGDRL